MSPASRLFESVHLSEPTRTRVDILLGFCRFVFSPLYCARRQCTAGIHPVQFVC